jgi:HlyD family secretion protein
LFQIVDLAHPRVTLRISERIMRAWPGSRADRHCPRARQQGGAPARHRDLGAGRVHQRKATRQNAGFDARSFEIKLEPAERIEGLRPGMSVLFDWPQ